MARQAKLNGMIPQDKQEARWMRSWDHESDGGVIRV